MERFARLPLYIMVPIGTSAMYSYIFLLYILLATCAWEVINPPKYAYQQCQIDGFNNVIVHI